MRVYKFEDRINGSRLVEAESFWEAVELVMAENKLLSREPAPMDDEEHTWTEEDAEGVFEDMQPTSVALVTMHKVLR